LDSLHNYKEVEQMRNLNIITLQRLKSVFLMSFCSSVLIIQRSLIWYSIFNLLSLCSYYLKKKLEAAGAGIGVVAVVAGTTEVGSALRATLGALGGVLATEEVQAVDDMEHAVARDGVVLRIRAAHRAD
jgi:hypothetical protein